jgi:hypothetical protein
VTAIVFRFEEPRGIVKGVAATFKRHRRESRDHGCVALKWLHSVAARMIQSPTYRTTCAAIILSGCHAGSSKRRARSRAPLSLTRAFLITRERQIIVPRKEVELAEPELTVHQMARRSRRHGTRLRKKRATIQHRPLGNGLQGVPLGDVRSRRLSVVSQRRPCGGSYEKPSELDQGRFSRRRRPLRVAGPRVYGSFALASGVRRCGA